MEREQLYLASPSIAERAHCINSSYRTRDGRYIITESDLRSIGFQMTAEEYVTGLDAEMITADDARRLMRENNYLTGRQAEPSDDGNRQEAAFEEPKPEQEPKQEPKQEDDAEPEPEPEVELEHEPTEETAADEKTNEE